MTINVMQSNVNIQEFSSIKKRKAYLHGLGRKTVKQLLDREKIHYNEITNSKYSHDKGRPIILSNIDSPGHISISHNDNFVVTAFSKKQSIGIDIEEITKRSPAFYKYSFTKDEQTLINMKKSLSDFISTLLWTAKESVLKAEGIGLSVSATTVRSYISFSNCNDFYLNKINTVSYIATFNDPKSNTVRYYYLTSSKNMNNIVTIAKKGETHE